MKNKVCIIFLTMLIASATAVWAQEAQETGTELEGSTVFTRFPSALGAYGCTSTTGGLTYQRWFGRTGLEATIGAIAGTDGTFDYNVQAAFQYMLYGDDFADWFSGALYTNVLAAHRGENNGGTYVAHEYLGLGVGIEMVFLGHLSTSVEFMYVGSLPLELSFGFGGSLKYRF